MKQDQHKAYAWVFSDGTKSILQTDTFTTAELEYVQELDRLEINNARRYRRHNVSLESLIECNDKSLLFMDTHAEFEDAILDQLEAQYWHTQLEESIAELSSAQVHLLNQVFTEKRSLREIASLESISVNATWKRLLTVLRKLQKNLR